MQIQNSRKKNNYYMFSALILLMRGAQGQCFEACASCVYTTTPPTCAACMPNFYL
jgi:hypothetical protein